MREIGHVARRAPDTLDRASERGLTARLIGEQFRGALQHRERRTQLMTRGFGEGPLALDEPVETAEEAVDRTRDRRELAVAEGFRKPHVAIFRTDLFKPGSEFIDRREQAAREPDRGQRDDQHDQRPATHDDPAVLAFQALALRDIETRVDSAARRIAHHHVEEAPAGGNEWMRAGRQGNELVRQISAFRAIDAQRLRLRELRRRIAREQFDVVIELALQSLIAQCAARMCAEEKT